MSRFGPSHPERTECRVIVSGPSYIEARVVPTPPRDILSARDILSPLEIIWRLEITRGGLEIT